jgi:pSer/pThr/pTyr-binding forkhead associated (FHA) protein
MAPAVEPYAGGPIGAGDTRRIVGALITYTWNTAGDLFPVKEGKNFIGAGEVHSDASHQQCEVLISQDPRMSAEHALILYRHGRYDLYDQQSSNGTFLGNEMIPTSGTELPNNAVIRTGSTVWAFVKLAPPQGTRAVTSSVGSTRREESNVRADPPEVGPTDPPEVGPKNPTFVP